MNTPTRLLALAATCLLSSAALADVPAALDRTAIADGMNRVKPQVQACAKTAPAKGIVKVAVAVKPDGTVASATLKEPPPDPALGECVLAAVKTATFTKTRKGGSFGYPFVF